MSDLGSKKVVELGQQDGGETRGDWTPRCRGGVQNGDPETVWGPRHLHRYGFRWYEGYARASHPSSFSASRTRYPGAHLEIIINAFQYTALRPSCNRAQPRSWLVISGSITDQPAAAEHGAGSAAGGLGNAGRVALPCMRCVADVGLVPNTVASI